MNEPVPADASPSSPVIVLVRHGETEWSRTGRHTGRTDVPLTADGRRQAEAVGRALRGRVFSLVLVSPLKRAMQTCSLAGLAGSALPRSELTEWDYGRYEGLTSAQIRTATPGWTLWQDGVPGGETVDQVAARVDPVIAELRATAGDAAVFGHGHCLRVLAARWLGLEAAAGRLFALDAGSISVLGYEHETPALRLWNERPA
jgi:broad specificity phosphatase PhoE